MKIIQIFGLANGQPCVEEGLYIKRFDAEPHRPDGEYDGGELRVTDDPNSAKQFENAAEAMQFWKTQPSCTCHRKRPDGKPNRPLTAYTVSVIDAPSKATETKG